MVDSAVVVSAANYSHIFLTQCYDMQVLNEASLLAATNIGNHASTNIFNFTRRWLNLQSWLTLLLRASTGSSTDANILQLLPRFTSLDQPPADVLQRLQDLVQQVRRHMGPLPAYTKSVFKSPEQYLPWMHKVLADLSSAQDQLLNQQTLLDKRLSDFQQQQNQQPQLQHLQEQQLQQQLTRVKVLLKHTRLFTLLPQKSNTQQFITITTAGLHRYNDPLSANLCTIALCGAWKANIVSAAVCKIFF